MSNSAEQINKKQPKNVLVMDHPLCKRGHIQTIENVYSYNGKKQCKICHKIMQDIWKKTKNGIHSHKKAKKKYRKSKKGINSFTNYRKKYPIKMRNRYFIRHQLENGKLVKTKICSNCGRRGYTEFHHDVYHYPAQLKDISELCTTCHREADKNGQ